MDNVEFYILNWSSTRHVLRFIKMQPISLSQYNLMIEFLSIRKEEYKVYDVEEGIVFEEGSLCRQSLGLQQPEKVDSVGLDPWERDGIMHGMWMPTETVDLLDEKALKYLLKSVYGKYGFQRSVSKCLGLNTYLGKRKASFVRPLPKMSQDAAMKSEYYRQEWNPTFHPIIYKLVNALTAQATRYQHLADPIYDKFLLEVLNSLLEGKNERESKASQGLRERPERLIRKGYVESLF